MSADRKKCVEILQIAQADRRPCRALTDEFELSESDAYAIQQSGIERRLDEGASRVGWKVGLTSDAIQGWLGVDEPDFGTLLDDMVVPDDGTADVDRLLQPRAEGEVAFVLGRDLAGPGVTVSAVLQATEFLLPAVEVIDSRIADWNIQWADTVADNASSGLFVLGSTPVELHAVDLRLAGMALRKNGRVVSTGAGAACLGNPANAVAWLANKLAEMGATLSAGDIVLSGALGPVTEVVRGDRIAVEIAGLGQVRCRFD